MSIDLFINTEAESIERAVVSGLGSPQSPVSVREFVQGLEQDFNLYLIDPDGSYDARSGTDIPVKVSVSVRGGYPSQGEFVITDDSGDTSTIAHDASAATVEAALNAMNSDTGPQGGLVDVTKKGDGCYLLVWRDVGVRAALTGTSQTLSPESTVNGSISVTGSATVRCQQIIELASQPIIYSDDWTQITNGWSGALNANSGRAIQALGDKTELPVFIEVTVDGIALAQADTRLLASVGGLLSQAAPPLPSATLDWGQIEGTLANQTDLQAALEGKATSAQGALADSAIQTEDIDTFAELDAIVADETLLNTSTGYTQAAADVLLDAKSDVAHTHTADNITDAGTFGKQLLQSETLGDTALIPNLDVTLANIAANTVAITGPALAETTDGYTLKLPEGFTAPADNDKFEQGMFTKDGVFEANLQLAPVETVIPDTGVMGMNNGRASVGDGETQGGLDLAYAADASQTIIDTYYHTLTKAEAAKAVMFVSTKATAITYRVFLTTTAGKYMKIVDGGGGETVVAATTNSIDMSYVSGDSRPRFYAIYPCDAGGTVDATNDITVLRISSSEIVAADIANLDKLTEASLNDNKLASLIFHPNVEGLEDINAGYNRLRYVRLPDYRLALTRVSLLANYITDFKTTGLTNVGPFASSFKINDNPIKSFLWGDLTMLENEYSTDPALDLSDMLLDATALQAFYESLPVADDPVRSHGNTLVVSGNPGAGAGSGTDPTVASAKGWTVDGDVV